MCNGSASILHDILASYAHAQRVAARVSEASKTDDYCACDRLHTAGECARNLCAACGGRIE